MKYKNQKRACDRRPFSANNNQQATKDKWRFYDELSAYTYHLREIAKIEFANDPQLLEKLGIFRRS